MSDQENPSSAEIAAVSELEDRIQRTPIVRDSTFGRFIADRIIFTDLGRDLEVSFLQMGPVYKFMEEAQDAENYESSKVLTETARLRVDYAVFLNSFMSFIRAGIEGDRLKGHAIAKVIQEWSEQYQGQIDQGSKE